MCGAHALSHVGHVAEHMRCVRIGCLGRAGDATAKDSAAASSDSIQTPAPHTGENLRPSDTSRQSAAQRARSAKNETAPRRNQPYGESSYEAGQWERRGARFAPTGVAQECLGFRARPRLVRLRAYARCTRPRPPNHLMHTALAPPATPKQIATVANIKIHQACTTRERALAAGGTEEQLICCPLHPFTH